MAPPTRILEGKLALVTGSSRGIGAAIAENLASKGANVVLNYTSDSSASTTEELAKRLESTHGIRTTAIKADLGDPAGASQLVYEARQWYAPGGKFQVDILVNNAGVSVNNPVGKIDIDDFDRQYHINVRGPLLLMQAIEPYLPHDRSGRVVNVSSVSATAGFPSQSIYGGTKAALESMTRTWAREFSERCTVNAVNPGPVKTDMWGSVSDDFVKSIAGWTDHTPLARVRPGVDPADVVKTAELMHGRPAYPEEIAGTVAMLCTPDCAWTTGSTVCSNGGLMFTH